MKVVTTTLGMTIFVAPDPKEMLNIGRSIGCYLNWINILGRDLQRGCLNMDQDCNHAVGSGVTSFDWCDAAFLW